jgi:hypothetical protein
MFTPISKPWKPMHLNAELVKQTACRALCAAALALLSCTPSQDLGRSAPVGGGTMLRSDSSVAPRVTEVADAQAAARVEQDAGPSTLVQLATRWVDALRDKNVEALTKLSQYPFDLRDTRKDGACVNKTVRGPGDMPSAVDCLLVNWVLNDELKANPTPTTKVVSPKELPSWARRWVKEIGPGLTAVDVFIHGNGSSFQFILLVADEGVQGFWKTAWFEAN